MPRTYEPVQLNGESTFRITDRFSPTAMEGLYGLGQHQSGMFNYRGSTVELAQDNTDVAIPVLMSSKGYALMWNTASLTYVDNRFPLDLTLSSIAGTSIDYYFLYGPAMDTVIHEYRALTGHAVVTEMGLRTLPVEGPVCVSRRNQYHRPALSAGTYSAGCDRAGLVLVEDGG